MELIWQFIKDNMGAAIGLAGGLAAGAATGMYFGGGFSFFGILAGMAGAAVAATAGLVAGDAIDKRRTDGHDFNKITPDSPLASKQIEVTSTEAHYAVKPTDKMWDKISSETAALNLDDHQKKALAIAKHLSQKMQIELKGTQVGDVFTLKSLEVEGYVDPVSFAGKDIQLQIKDKEIDFSHPNTVVGFDKMVATIYEQRLKLFDDTRKKVQPLIDGISAVKKIPFFGSRIVGDRIENPDVSLNAIRDNIAKGDLKNPYHNLMPDKASAIIGYDFLQNMAEKHGTDGLKIVLKNRLMRFVDPAKVGQDGETVLNDAKINTIVDTITNEYSKNADLQKMSSEQARAHFVNLAAPPAHPELLALQQFVYPKYSNDDISGANGYSMMDYTLDLIETVHKPVAEGLQIRKASGKTASLDTKKPETQVVVLAEQFKAGKFDGISLESQPLINKKDEKLDIQHRA